MRDRVHFSDIRSGCQTRSAPVDKSALYVAVMLHGAADTIVQPLITQGNMLQYVAIWTGRLKQEKPAKLLILAGVLLEATPGIEPGCTDLQSAA